MKIQRKPTAKERWEASGLEDNFDRVAFLLSKVCDQKLEAIEGMPFDEFDQLADELAAMMNRNGEHVDETKKN